MQALFDGVAGKWPVFLLSGILILGLMYIWYLCETADIRRIRKIKEKHEEAKKKHSLSSAKLCIHCGYEVKPGENATLLDVLLKSGIEIRIKKFQEDRGRRHIFPVKHDKKIVCSGSPSRAGRLKRYLDPWMIAFYERNWHRLKTDAKLPLRDDARTTDAFEALEEKVLEEGL